MQGVLSFELGTNGLGFRAWGVTLETFLVLLVPKPLEVPSSSSVPDAGGDRCKAEALEVRCEDPGGSTP